jgi:hypothetical protein
MIYYRSAGEAPDVSPGPGGTFDNSPMLEHWVKQVHGSRPEGTAEIRLSIVPSGLIGAWARSQR